MKKPKRNIIRLKKPAMYKMTYHIQKRTGKTKDRINVPTWIQKAFHPHSSRESTKPITGGSRNRPMGITIHAADIAANNIIAKPIHSNYKP